MSGQVEFNALVLAGGKSSRMRQAKHQLSYLGKSFLEHTTNLLSAISPKQIYISGNNIEGAIPDLLDDIGPLAGIHAVTKQSNLSLLVLAIDTPLIRPTDLQRLIDVAIENTKCAAYHGSPIPCFLNKDSHYIDIVEEMIETHTQPKDLSLYTLCKKTNAIMLPNESVNLSNINTPEQYERLLAGEVYIDDQ